MAEKKDSKPTLKPRRKKPLHENTIAHQWIPGQSGNPAGKPKGVLNYKNRIQNLFLSYLEEEIDDPNAIPGAPRRPALDIFMQNFIRSALAGDPKSGMFLMDRLVESGVIDSIDNYINRGRREDNYFLSYQIYKDAFDEQQRLLMSKQRLILTMSGRRAGKTEAIQRKIVDTLSIYEGCQVVYVARTITIGIDQVWNGVKALFDHLGIAITEERRTEGYLKLQNGSEFWVKGNIDKTARENLRGYNWKLAIVDECQSQRELDYLVTSILEPPVIQNRGQIMLCGTGPRIRGTDWERIWNDPDHYPGLRLNWNISKNPFVEDASSILEAVKTQHGWTDATPRFIQEWLGRVAYDDDALIYRLTSQNLYQDTDLQHWIRGHHQDSITVGWNPDGTRAIPHSPADIKFVGGIDYGSTDADSVVVLMYSDLRPEIWLVYEHKATGQGVEALRQKIVEAMNFVKNSPLFQEIPEYNRTKWFFHQDSGGGGKKIGTDFSAIYNLPIQNAYKAEKLLGIEQLREEVSRGFFKVLGRVITDAQGSRIESSSSFFDESIRTVFKRDDDDHITREIDDDAFHPDELDATLYAYRSIALFRKQER
jgi:hypothetical protein